MAISPTSPLTGAAQVDLTSPTYTLTSDTPPNAHSVQWAVTALGGTQTGVDAHSVSSPFTLTIERPATFKRLGTPNPTTGVISNVPNNVYVVRTRKGVEPDTDQPERVAMAETRIPVPAGSDLNDNVALQAMLSAHIGLLTDVSSALGDLVQDGVL